MQLFSYLRPYKASAEGRPRCVLQNVVRVRCDHCSHEFDIKYKALALRKLGELCKSCSVRAAQRSRVRYSTSEETKAKLKAAFTPELRAELSQRFSGAGNAGYRSGKWAGKNDKHNAHLAAWRGKTNAQIHGVAKAAEISKKLSERCKGSLNPMYGKPAPMGSGSGWSGWFKGRYFRSLLELSFMLANPTAQSAERLSIKYMFNGRQRTYRPDFILDDKIIELKPNALLSTSENRAKFEAARAQLGEAFIVLTDRDVLKLQLNELAMLVQAGTVSLIAKYQERLNAHLSSHHVL